MSDLLFDSKNKSNQNLSSSNNLSDKKEESEKFNNDSLLQNPISNEKIDLEDNDKSLYENEEDKYNILMTKYKKLEEENKNLKEEIKKNEIIIEEQNSDILLLKSSIENDFFQNNDIKKYITKENIIDFIKLKTENEQYKKELVLSQALINSLQTENVRLTKAKEENSDIINIETEDFLSNSENRVYDINSNRENEIINELNKENNILKKLIQEATVKLNSLVINEKNNKILSTENNILSFQLKEKDDIINKYEEKLSYFNNYINSIKSSFNQIKQYIINAINSYNKLANEDLNSLLSNNFSQNIMKISMQISSMDDIEQYNLDTKPELDMHNIIYEFLSNINDEFIILYEKVFQTNNYFKESSDKVNELETELKEYKVNYSNISNNEMTKLKDEYVKTIIKLNLELNEKESDNFYLKENSNYFRQDLDDIINILNLIINIFNNNNEIKLSKHLNIYIKNIKEKNNLLIEKEEIIKNIMKNNHKIKKMKLEKKNVDNLKMYKDEYINDIINDFEKKIKEKENQIIKNREQINSLLQ